MSPRLPSAEEEDEDREPKKGRSGPEPEPGPGPPIRKKAKRKGRLEDKGPEAMQSSASLAAEWPLEPGMILHVRMRNFMCHQDYTFDPNQRLTFLCGSNGSGKSAVLSAVIFALGGSARTTNRGSSNRQLVRSGQREASVEIKMHNGDGEDSFKPELYGKAVSVVRTVKAQGGGGYRFMDERGRTVKLSKPREELEKMLSTFKIQVVTWLAIMG